MNALFPLNINNINLKKINLKQIPYAKELIYEYVPKFNLI